MTMRSPRTPGFTMNRRGFLSLAVATGALAACGAPNSGGDDDGASGGGAGSGKFKAATYIPPSYEDLYPAFTMFMDKVKEATGDKSSFDMFDSGKLLAADQLVPGLTRGVTDIAFQTSSYVSTTYPVLGCIELPFANEGTKQVQSALAIDGELHKLINAELGKKGLHMISSMPTAPEYIWTKDKEIKAPGDLKGMRIRTAGVVEGETVKAMGGAPVSMSSAELYEALERGTIDGMISYPGTIISRDLQDVLKYGTEGHFGLYSVDIYCRKDWFDGLEEETASAINEAAKVYLEDGTNNQLKVHEEKYFPAMKEAGMQITQLSESETAAFKEASSKVEQWWKGQVGDEATATKALELVRGA